MIKQAKNTFVGNHQFHFSKLGSTNKFLEEFFGFEACEKSFVVSTDFQTKGLGQRGNYWESEPKQNLLFSIFSFPESLLVNQMFSINKMISVSIAEVLEELKIVNVKIKWPNDILFEDSKIAGILIENSIQTEKIKSLVIGIGMNVNQMNFEQHSREATSIKKILNAEINRFELLNYILSKIEKNFQNLKSNNTAFDRKYLERLYQKDVWRGYLIKGERKNACIKGVSFDGALDVLTVEGKMVLKNKEIVFI